MNLSSHRQRWQESGQIRTKTTIYHYTAHRLDSVSYDDALSTVYHYNAYGQPDSVYDESGVMCYEYGNMGEVTRETRIYALPFLSQPLALSTLFEYDSWGRILNITYPDNEIVNYDYDLGGQLFRFCNNNYNYLDSVLYDRFGAKTSQKYGNGIKTNYSYDNLTRRLSNITTTDGNSQLSAIAYTYDLVGNVTQVTSICPWLQNQSFTETFSYDSTDQLISANETQSYQLAVNYGNWGKVMQYDIAQTDMLSNATETHSRNYTYPAANYSNAQTSFAPIMQTGDEQISLSYGINGSLRKRETTQPQQHTEYYLFNSQGNLKAYSDDVMSFAYYGYNAANTRTYKLSLYNTNLWINGQQQPLNLQLQQAMFYPNTYLNFNQNGEYTKHYYNGTERIASRLGDNTTTIALNNNILEDRKLQLEEQFRVDIHKLIEETVPIDMPPFIDVNDLQPTGTPNDIYYYHPNHLGSTAFVTDQNQTITQGFLYAPFGEITTEYNVNFGNNVIPKYSFNAKELDEETGMYYYEARYYAPPVFTSRDPLFEKYPSISPYTYCMNNPIKYVDPDGRIPWYSLIRGYNKNYIPKPPTSERKHPVLGEIRPHHGMDMPASKGSIVSAAAEGTIYFSGTKKGYGNTIVIDHGNGYYSLYAHLDKIYVQDGENVKNGGTIGEVGNTGISSGPHLHVEYIKTNNPKDIFGKNKNSSRFNPMDVIDLQDVLSEKETALIQFLDEKKEIVGKLDSKTYLNPKPDPTLGERLRDSKKPILNLIGKLLE